MKTINLVMVVDDDSLIRAYASLLLETAGFDVIACCGPKEALVSFETGSQPDLLFTDVLLDGYTSGFQLASVLCVRYPSLKVLYTSGYAHPEHFGSAPADFEFLQKPYTRHSLFAAISRILAISDTD